MVKKNDKNKEASAPEPEVVEEVAKRPKTPKELERAVKMVMDKLNKKYGAKTGSEIRFASEYYTEAVGTPTGFVQVDEATGIGGMPSKAIVEIYGPESVGKSYLAQHIVGNKQKADSRYCVYADLEGSLQVKNMKNIGVDVDKLIRIDFDIAETIFEEVKGFITSGSVSTVVIDSVAALFPKMEAEADYEDSLYAAKARLLSRVLPEMAMLSQRFNVLIIFINQLRVKLGAYNTPEDTPGGKSLKYFAHMRLDCKAFYDKSGAGLPSRIMSEDGTIQIGQRVNVKFVKNKFAPPFREGMFELYYAKADMVRSVIFMAKKEKMWFTRTGKHVYASPTLGRIEVDNEEGFVRELIMSNAVIEMADALKARNVLPDRFDYDEFILSLEKIKENIMEEDEEAPEVQAPAPMPDIPDDDDDSE